MSILNYKEYYTLLEQINVNYSMIKSDMSENRTAADGYKEGGIVFGAIGGSLGLFLGGAAMLGGGKVTPSAVLQITKGVAVMTLVWGILGSAFYGGARHLALLNEKKKDAKKRGAAEKDLKKLDIQIDKQIEKVKKEKEKAKEKYKKMTPEQKKEVKQKAEKLLK